MFTENVPLVRFRAELERIESPSVYAVSMPGGWCIRLNDAVGLDLKGFFVLSLARSTDVRVFRSLDSVHSFLSGLGVHRFVVKSEAS